MNINIGLYCLVYFLLVGQYIEFLNYNWCVKGQGGAICIQECPTLRYFMNAQLQEYGNEPPTKKTENNLTVCQIASPTRSATIHSVIITLYTSSSKGKKEHNLQLFWQESRRQEHYVCRPVISFNTRARAALMRNIDKRKPVALIGYESRIAGWWLNSCTSQDRPINTYQGFPQCHVSSLLQIEFLWVQSWTYPQLKSWVFLGTWLSPQRCLKVTNVVKLSCHVMYLE